MGTNLNTYETISRITLGDMLLIFELDRTSGVVGFHFLPQSMEQMDLSSQKFYRIDNISQLKLVGDCYPNCYGNGNSMRDSYSANHFSFKDQQLETEADSRFRCNITKIKTTLEDSRGYLFTNLITYYEGEDSFEMKNIFSNHSFAPVTLEMLASFEIGNLTPFSEGDAPNTMLLHRLRTRWSHEGRLVSEPIEELQLEPSWGTWPENTERFGARGSMPVMKYFPFAAIEDQKANVLWGVQLATESSWQIEAFRRDDCLHLSGGIADREFGHWMKTIDAGESFESITAILSCCKGDIDSLCHRLTSAGKKYLVDAPESEQNLPIVFNEYCTTWGNPSHENIEEILSKIDGRGIEYFVIDCGWFKADGVPWDVSMGDYKVSKNLFPNGLDKTVSMIHNHGMKAGIWFEIDNIGPRAKAYEEYTDHMLKRDGHVLTTYSRRFWNMCDPWVNEYLTKRVIGTLKDYHFDYMKMDYNDTIGIGCDHPDSLGEGLRQNMEASVEFVRQIKKALPDLLLENCASGGHKLEPLMMRECAMASFSDAHETAEIPIIAANLHRAILPRQSQIWAVLRKDDSLKRIGYSMVNTFLGRMCLSGDVAELTDAQWDVIQRGIDFYKLVSYIIKEGISHRIGPHITSDRHPQGWQCIKRIAPNGDALLVLHIFDGKLPSSITINISDCNSKCIDYYTYAPSNATYECTNKALIFTPKENMSAIVFWLH